MRDIVIALLEASQDDLIIETHRDREGKYGRLLATVWCIDTDDPEQSWYSLNDWLLKENHARPYGG